MNRAVTPPPPAPAVRYDTRYGTTGPARERRACAVCATALTAPRARYCSDACKQRAYRLRQVGPAPPDTTALAVELRQLGQLAAHRVYECPSCSARYLREQRCPDCNRFCRALGLGGVCPHCEEPVLVSELLG